MSESATLSIRVSQHLLDRIDQAAQRAGETRSTYILSWLPETYDTPSRDTIRTTQNSTTPHDHNAR